MRVFVISPCTWSRDFRNGNPEHTKRMLGGRTLPIAVDSTGRNAAWLAMSAVAGERVLRLTCYAADRAGEYHTARVALRNSRRRWITDHCLCRSRRVIARSGASIGRVQGSAGNGIEFDAPPNAWIATPRATHEAFYLPVRSSRAANDGVSVYISVWFSSIVRKPIVTFRDLSPVNSME